MKINLQLFAQSLEDIAKDVIKGKYGNGQARKDALGDKYAEVQAIVNSMLGSSSSTTSKTPTTSTTTTPATTANNGFTYTPYEKSDVVKQAEAMLEQHKANAPGEYQSNWQAQLNETLDKILNREKFSYDLNGDALYQQYKDQYMLQGQKAMMDTMGQVAAMNGGYGSSYAQTAGQQTYQGYLQQLNDRVPELYQLALNQYNQEGQDLYNQYGLYADKEEQEYGRYRDTVSDYNTELERLINEARYQGETEYNQYMDKTNMDYTMYSDAKEDAFNLATSYIAAGIMPSSNVLAAAGISSTDAQAFVNKVKSDEAKANNQNNNNNNQNNNNNNNEGDDPKLGDNPIAAAIPDDIKKKAATFEDNESLANWAYGLADSGKITEDQADQLIAENMDNNEKYTTDENGTSKISYKNMVASTKGWTVVDDGGGNLLGIDKNAKVKSPNGETLTLAQLRDKLKGEGMSTSDANKAIKALQQNLGISSNWLFGL